MARPKIPAGAKIGTVQNPAVKGHNEAETDWEPNPNNDPKLIYQAGLDSTDERGDDDTFVSPEYMDQSTGKKKNYLVYENTLTAAEIAKIEVFINI